MSITSSQEFKYSSSKIYHQNMSEITQSVQEKSFDIKKCEKSLQLVVREFTIKMEAFKK